MAVHATIPPSQAIPAIPSPSADAMQAAFDVWSKPRGADGFNWSKLLAAAYAIDFQPAILADREESAKEIAWLKAELAAAHSTGFELAAEVNSLKEKLSDANESFTVAYMLGAEKAKDEIARLKADLAIAETATRKALEAVPIAMTAARNKEREACAQTVEDERVDDDETGQLDDCAYNLALDHAAAAIRARASEATNG